MSGEQDGADGIWTTAAFLARCAPEIRTIFEYWNGKRGNRRMPARRDLDPVLEIPQLLPSLTLVDVHHDPFRLIYRLVGTVEAQRRGNDPTGKDVLRHFFGTKMATPLFNYTSVIERRSFLYRADPIPTRDGWHVNVARLFLPLSDDGETVDIVMLYRVWETAGTRVGPLGSPTA